MIFVFHRFLLEGVNRWVGTGAKENVKQNRRRLCNNSTEIG